MKQALCLCILLFAAAASGQQSTVTKVSPEDGLYHKEPIIVVDESTTPPTLITSWMSFTTAGESYVRTAWSQGTVWIPATILEDSPDPQKFLAPKTSVDGTLLRDTNGKLLTYKISGDPFSAITTSNELYLVTVSCDGVSTCQDNKTAISLWKSINHGDTWGLEKNLCAQEYPNDPSGAPANDPCRQPGYADVDKPSIAVSNNSLYVAHLIFSRDGAFSPAIVVHQRANGTWTAKKFDASAPGSPIVVVADRVYVVWLSREPNLNRIYVTYSSDPNNPMLFDQREFIDIGGRFSTCLKDCRDSGSDCASLMDATSNLMARYNAQNQSIAIVWHATAATETQADMKFISFSTATKHFVEASPVTVDQAAPGNQWTPGIDCGPYGAYGRCLITYYQSSQCSSNPNDPNSVKFRPHAILVDARGNTVGTGGWDITPDESDPKGYRPPGATKDSGMGEYQGVYYSAGKWYSAFLQVLIPMTGEVYAGELVPACSIAVSPASVPLVPASGGSVHFDVTLTPEGCTSWTPAWALGPPPDWASIDNAATRYTSGSFNVSVQANTGSQRQATLTVAGKSIVIQQQGQGCASLPRRVAVAPSLASKTDHPVLTTVPDSGSVLHYDWYERLPGETTPRLYYKHTWSITVTPSQSLTYYSAVVRNSCGDTVSLAEVPVYLCVPTIDSQPVDQFVPFGTNASLSVAASPAIPGQPLTVTWWSYDTGQMVGSGPTFSFTPEPGTTRTYYGYVGADCSGLPFTKQTNAVTVTAAPAPRDAQVLSQTVPTTMTALRSYTVSATLKNRGTESWSPVGPSPQCNVFRLGSTNPQDNLTWGRLRADLPTTVAPDGQVTISFPVTAPATPGTYNFQWKMLQECVTWFGDPTPNVAVNVQPAPPRDAQILSQSVPATMAAGRVYPVSVTLKNVGTETWSPIGPQCNAYRFGTANPYGNGTFLPATRVELPTSVPPGGLVTLNFNVTAPSTPGTYNFQWRMLQECVTWFGDLTPNVVVTVQPAPVRDAQILSQTVPSSMVAGQSYPVSIRVRNTGTQTWSPIGPQCNAYRFGTANPYGNGTFLPATRVELPAPVAPGGEVTLNFTVTAPATPGTYNFQGQMVQECVTWFGDFTPNVGVTVSP